MSTKNADLAYLIEKSKGVAMSQKNARSSAEFCLWQHHIENSGSRGM